MYDADAKHQFLELRAKGWSLARIAERLKVGQRTLVDWNRQEHEQIRTLRAIESESLQEKILATREQELTRLKTGVGPFGNRAHQTHRGLHLHGESLSPVGASA